MAGPVAFRSPCHLYGLMKQTIRVMTVVIGAMCAACYNQAPLATFPPPPHTHIVAQLSDSGTVAMGSALGPGVIAVAGVVEKADEKTWLLHMVSADQKDGRTIDWNQELVSFPASIFIQPQIRVLDKKKSWLAAAAIMGGAFLAARGFNLIGSNGDKGDSTGPAASLIPGGGK
jgi:hypothetical protein